MSLDPHEVRMAVGQQAAEHLDLLNDETLALIEEAIDGFVPLIRYLEEREVAPMAVMQFCIGAVIGAAFRER